jgi:hypothetical protein
MALPDVGDHQAAVKTGESWTWTDTVRETARASAAVALIAVGVCHKSITNGIGRWRPLSIFCEQQRVNQAASDTLAVGFPSEYILPSTAANIRAAETEYFKKTNKPWSPSEDWRRDLWTLKSVADTAIENARTRLERKEIRRDFQGFTGTVQKIIQQAPPAAPMKISSQNVTLPAAGALRREIARAQGPSVTRQPA